MTDTIPETLKKAITRYATVRTQREEMEPKFKRLEEQERELGERIYSLMDEFDMKSVVYGKLGRITKMQRGPYCSIRADEETVLASGDVQETYREQFEAWCVANEMDDVLIKRMPVMTRVNSYVKEAITSGKTLPEGINLRYVLGVTWSGRSKAR